ncbi:MAG: tRNA glutamyl-Q(34) synthetase GluQRS [Pseudomonadota bacterium]
MSTADAFTSDTSTAYRGRFAPSPTGPLHLGSLIAALASYLDARHSSGTWLVRMEDLDPPREEPGAARKILDSLIAHGLTWDGDVLWQSQRHAAYQEALKALAGSHKTFACTCTRAQIGPDGYCGGGCNGLAPTGIPFATRVRVPVNTVVRFEDKLQGQHTERLGTTLKDFVLLRKDGLFAYQLAVVVDDAHQGITHVVRGSDLLDSTARQIFLQQQLGLATPAYSHIPVLLNDEGQKLSKQNQAPALDDSRAPSNLRVALGFLNQRKPPETDSVSTILAHAITHWDAGALPRSDALYPVLYPP